jgi:glycosyltransferase involved in cell wall biosynthesis
VQKINLVIIIPTLNSGGAEKMAVDLASHLEIVKVKLKIICLFPNTSSPFNLLAEKRGIEVEYLDKKKGFSLFTIVRLYKLLNKIKPDVVHTHLNASIYAMFWKVIHKKCKWVHTIHNVANKELSKGYLFLMKSLYKNKICVPISISSEIRKSIADFYKLDLKNIELINNGIDTQYYVSNKNAKNEDDIVQLCCVARFSHQKNHEFLIKSFSEIVKDESEKKFILKLAGEGDLIYLIKDLVKELGIENRVEFLGNQNDVLNILQKSNVFILSSNYEGLPLSVLEAMSTGLPIIATNVGGLSDLITNGKEGYLVPSNDVLAMKKAVLLLGNDKIMQTRMGENARRKAEKFDVSVMAEKYYETYLKLIESGVK